MGTDNWGRVRRGIVRRDLAVAARLAAAHGPFLDHTLPALGRAANHSRLWLGTAAGLASTGNRKSRRGAARGLLAIGLSSPLVNVAAKQAARRARPLADSVPVIRRLRRAPLTSSFPSGHSASAAAFATGVLVENRVVGVPVAAVAAGVAVSRVVTGAHFPSDVVVGVALGVGAALATLIWWPNLPVRAARTAPAGPGVRAAPDGDGVEIVVNVGAGGVAAGAARRLQAELPAARVVEADAASFEHCLTEAAARCSVLGVVGGDGSARAAARHALDHGIPLLLIPAGTHNHLAGDLGLTDAADAVAAVRQGDAVAIDVGRAGDEIFLNTCTAGLYTDMVQIRRRFESGLGTWPAMALGVLHALGNRRPLDLVVAGKRRRLWVFFAGNARYGPRGFVPTYRRDLADGVIDARTVTADGHLSRLRLAVAVLSGSLSRSRVHQAAAVGGLRLASKDGPLLLSLDGEPRSFTAPIAVRKADRRLVVYRPAPATAPPIRH